jgi:hypothetical protein
MTSIATFNTIANEESYPVFINKDKKLRGADEENVEPSDSSSD